MKHLFFLFLFIPFVLSAQQPEGPPDWDTSYINTVIATDTTYFLVTDMRWNDEDGNLFYRDFKEEQIGKDSASVENYLSGIVFERVRYETRAVKRSFESRKLGSEADVLQDFTGLAYWRHSTAVDSTFYKGDYKVTISGTTYDAAMTVNTSGVLRLNVETVGTYSIRPQGRAKFEARNWEGSGQHTVFYFVKRTAKDKHVYRPKDFETFVIRKL